MTSFSPFFLLKFSNLKLEKRMSLFQIISSLPTLLRDEPKYDKINFYSSFFKVNDGNNFIAFVDTQNNTLGFTRDFYIDFMRCHYSKGNISYLNPRQIGLNQFCEKDAVFIDLFKEYEKILTLEYLKAKSFFEKIIKKKT